MSEHKRFAKMVERMGKMNLDGLDNEQVSLIGVLSKLKILCRLNGTRSR